MRIIVDIPDAYAELIKELEGYTSRQRAGRVRMLATMGLVTLKGGAAVKGAQPSSAAEAPTPDNKAADGGGAEQEKARSDMGKRMMGSLLG